MPPGREVQELAGGSLLCGRLPRGCELCGRGSKMVLFVTGVCESNCFYCPLSNDRAHQDVIFADEMPVVSDTDVVYEAEAIGAEGVGISGGDPLCSLDRTIHYIQLLKSRFGPEFHVHLYTSQTDADESVVQALAAAGLDEIRFHPQTTDWRAVRTALRAGLDVGLEVPALPQSAPRLRQLAIRAEQIGVGFININELEASETNFQNLVGRGYRLTDLSSSSIAGSAEAAHEVVQWAAGHLSLSVHYCSARFKDTVQIRNRLERRLNNTIRPFEERDSSEPLLIIGIVRAPHGSALSTDTLDMLYRVLVDDFDVPPDMMNVDYGRRRIEIAPWILMEIADELRIVFPDTPALEIGIAYEYPSWDRLQTMFDPL